MTLNTDITITSGTIAAGEHYYIGWDGIVSGLATPDTTTTSIYLADQQNQSSKYYCSWFTFINL